ncbi:hypothetical protein SLE2022_146380 [Rubroshorea leprosula]
MFLMTTPLPTCHHQATESSLAHTTYISTNQSHKFLALPPSLADQPKITSASPTTTSRIDFSPIANNNQVQPSSASATPLEASPPLTTFL